jgi:hypothetical protein
LNAKTARASDVIGVPCGFISDIDVSGRMAGNIITEQGRFFKRGDAVYGCFSSGLAECFL